MHHLSFIIDLQSINHCIGIQALCRYTGSKYCIVHVLCEDILFYFHSENILFMTLGKKLMKAGKENLFSTWMLQESDLVQGAAHAYGKSTSLCLI